MKKRQTLSTLSLLVATLVTTSGFSIESSNKVKDRALFRYENRVVFLSEARSQIKQLEKFRCLNKNWSSLKLTKLTKKDYPHYPYLPFSKNKLNEEREFIKRYIAIQQLKSFAKEQLVKISTNEFKKINKRACFPRGISSWPQEVKDLVKLEFYIQSRYNKNSKSEKELEQRLNSFHSTVTRKSNNVLFF